MRYQLYLDGLPAATIIRDPESGAVHTSYGDGIPVGKVVFDAISQQGRHILYNHLNILVKTQPVPESNELRIVGFEVEPRSYRPVKFQPEQEPAWNFTAHVPLYLEEQKNLPNAERNFDFTYSI